MELLAIGAQELLKKMERATGIEPVLPAWESKLSILHFQYLQICSEKMYVHALHTVHALPELRVGGGRLGDGFLSSVAVDDRRFEDTFGGTAGMVQTASAVLYYNPRQCRFAE